MSSKTKKMTLKRDNGDAHQKRKRGRPRKIQPKDCVRSNLDADHDSDSSTDDNGAQITVRSDLSSSEDFEMGSRTPKKLTSTNSGRKSPYSSDKLIEAYNAAQNGQSIRSSAAARGIPESTLRRYINERIVPGIDRRMLSPYFSLAEEKQLADHICYLSKLGYRFSRWKVLDMAADMMRVQGRTDTPSKQWYVGFSKRHPCTQISRLKEVSDPQLSHYFGELSKVFVSAGMKDSINPSSIISVNETVLNIDQNPPKVMKRKGSKGCGLLIDKIPAVTVIGAGKADGQNLPPYLVLNENTTGYKKALRKTIPEIHIDTSHNGWPSTKVYEDYCCSFLPTKIEMPAVVLFDGNNSHVSLNVVAKARQLGLHLFAFPVFLEKHAIDVESVFNHFKAEFISECGQLLLSDNPETELRKKICHIITKAYRNGMSALNLRTAFRQSGIYPFTRVLNTLKSEVNSKSFQKRRRIERGDKSSLNVAAPESDSEPDQPCNSGSVVESDDADDGEDARDADDDNNNNDGEDVEGFCSQTLCENTATSGNPQHLVISSGVEELIEIQDEVCVICQRSKPYMLEFVDPTMNVVVEWGRCHTCNRWVHLKFCSPFTQLGPSDTFLCPICSHIAR